MCSKVDIINLAKMVKMKRALVMEVVSRFNSHAAFDVYCKQYTPYSMHYTLLIVQSAAIAINFCVPFTSLPWAACRSLSNTEFVSTIFEDDNKDKLHRRTTRHLHRCSSLSGSSSLSPSVHSKGSNLRATHCTVAMPRENIGN